MREEREKGIMPTWGVRTTNIAVKEQMEADNSKANLNKTEDRDNANWSQASISGEKGGGMDTSTPSAYPGHVGT